MNQRKSLDQKLERCPSLTGVSKFLLHDFDCSGPLFKLFFPSEREDAARSILARLAVETRPLTRHRGWRQWIWMLFLFVELCKKANPGELFRMMLTDRAVKVLSATSTDNKQDPTCDQQDILGVKNDHQICCHTKRFL